MKIKSVSELYEIIKQIQWYRFGRTHMENYRGHSLREYKLLPGLGRYNFEISELAQREECLYNSFMESVKKGKIESVRRPFKEGDNFELRNDWYTLFQAQHLGLKTRLMDWSISWETSLLFAVNDEEHHGKDGSFWIFFCEREHLINDDNIKSITSVKPFEFKNDSMINTPIYLFDKIFDIVGEKRLGRQSGRFWLQSLEKSKIPLNEQLKFSKQLQEIIIDGNSKATIKRELNDRGINIDWKYYRKDENIEKSIKKINDYCLKMII